jgi:hypothetical protein
VTEQEYQPETDNNQQIFNVFEELQKLPNESDSMLTDVYFSDFPGASSGSFGSTVSCRCDRRAPAPAGRHRIREPG